MSLGAIGHSREALTGKSWGYISMLGKPEGMPDVDYDQRAHEKAQEIREALGPILGRKPHLCADALAIALRYISPKLQQYVVDSRHWEAIPTDEFGEDDAEY